MEQVTRYRIFLASPGDLSAERESVRRTVDLINHNAGAELGFSVELLGWEDTLPGAGRPQSLINQDVDSCDLFIGVLHKRWGTPTGEFESGFHEEFVRAEHRRDSSSAPDIWLFFKELDSQLLADPGEQLQRVVRFKREIQGRHFYKEFSEKADLAQKLQAFLTKHLISAARPAEGEYSGVQGGIDAAPETTGNTVVEPSEALQQVADSLSKLADAPVVISRDPRQANLTAFETARIHLLGSALFADDQGELLSVHHQNTERTPKTGSLWM